jgi:hypothetical protein
MIRSNIRNKYSTTNKLLLAVVLLLMVILLNPTNANSQYSFGAGLTTLTILGDNPATKPFFERDTAKPNLFGGSFDGPQVGVSFRLNYSLDTIGQFVIPIGLDYNFFESRERVPVSSTVTAYYKNSTSIPTLSLGLDVMIKKWDIADAKIYAGLDARMSIVQQGKYESDLEYLNFDTVEVLIRNTKSTVNRYGFNLKLGLQGRLDGPIYMNSWVSYGIMNLIGRDDKRGELLTPFRQTTYIEDKESFVHTLHFNFMIQYKF